MSPRAAFTLVELLVVVAVIAILAAIAVPNFLEAMARSKVSRTKADLRTVSLALEVYRVDTNRYPPDFQYGVRAFVDRLKNLTTPVAFMTSVPGDPFVTRGTIEEYTAPKGTNAWREGGSKTAPYVEPLTYDYAFRISPLGVMESNATWGRISSSPGATLWAMRGSGPDSWPTYLGDNAKPYDPTNGTVSDGDIFWTGPGKGEDVPAIL